MMRQGCELPTGCRQRVTAPGSLASLAHSQIGGPASDLEIRPYPLYLVASPEHGNALCDPVQQVSSIEIETLQTLHNDHVQEAQAGKAPVVRHILHSTACACC